jgi:formate dehydrogenase (coenzyme F420) beta subunit
LVQHLASGYPDATFAIQVSSWDEGGLNKLYRKGQLDREKVVLVGVACPQDQPGYWECLGPWPSVIDSGEKCEPVLRSKQVDRVEALSGDEAFQAWVGAFNTCVKYYGCQVICPMCFGKECALKHPHLMSPGQVPPSGG